MLRFLNVRLAMLERGKEWGMQVGIAEIKFFQILNVFDSKYETPHSSNTFKVGHASLRILLGSRKKHSLFISWQIYISSYDPFDPSKARYSNKFRKKASKPNKKGIFPSSKVKKTNHVSVYHQSSL